MEKAIIVLSILFIYGLCRLVYQFFDWIHMHKENKEYDEILDNMSNEDWDDLYNYLYKRNEEE